MKPGPFFLAIFSLLSFVVKAVDDTGLKLHYTFENQGSKVLDQSGSHYDAQLMNQAQVRPLGSVQVLDLGDQNGYLDMGSAVGSLMAELQDFSISTAIYLDPNQDISGNGHFVWVFSTSSACGYSTGKYIAYRVNRQRYALSIGGYSQEVAALEIGKASPKGSWYRVTYTQEGLKGCLYIDSVEQKTSSAMTYAPKDIGQATTYNWIARPHFSGDSYLKKALLSDFRIYDRALSAEEIRLLSRQIAELNAAMNMETLLAAREQLSLPDTSDIIDDLDLPFSLANEIKLSWTSSCPEIINAQGQVRRPEAGSDTALVVLTAILSKAGDTVYKSFRISVLPYFSPEISLQRDLAALLFSENETRLKYKLHLPSKGAEGSHFRWISGNTAYLSHEGDLLQQPKAGASDVLLDLLVIAEHGDLTETRSFPMRIPAELNYYAYLFAYFTGNSGNQEAVRLALSFDGFNYKALNNNYPILASEEISRMGGVRDPHILRGIEDSSFYMVLTDMKSALGWNSNHGIVLLKSYDLIHWTHQAVDIAAEFADFSSINRAWAPQTFYDQNEGKYMIYWSMRSGSAIDRIYYAYANEDFDRIITVPKLLYDSPDATACIDGDIIYKEGKYHLFYKNEGTGNGIKKALADYVNGPYEQLSNKYYQQTTSAVEGSCVFKLYDSDNYILMYDVYTSGRYEFTISNDLENFSLIDGFSMDFSPRHGTVLPITRQEARRLVEKWGYGFDPIPQENALPRLADKEALLLWPLPVGDRLHVDLRHSDATPAIQELQVMRADGSLCIYHKHFEGNQIDCSKLSPGAYILRLKTAEAAYRSVFIKK